MAFGAYPAASMNGYRNQAQRYAACVTAAQLGGNYCLLKLILTFSAVVFTTQHSTRLVSSGPCGVLYTI